MSDNNHLVPLNFTYLSQEEMVINSEHFYRKMHERRSVRHFSDTPIDEQIVLNALKTAGTAPSGANKQPWHFCLIKDDDVKRHIRSLVEQEEKENYERRFSKEMKDDIASLQTDFSKPHLTDAPYLIVVFKENFRVVDGVRRKNYYVNESVGIACGMLITALHQSGLATLTHTPNPMKYLNSFLGRPDNESPVLVMPVGLPAEDAQVPDNRRKPLNEIVTII
ncbi:MAG: nitroreductase family protein [Balneolia bacterium]|nr:nitroreductase family protein [Balneolia bacterium]